MGAGIGVSQETCSLFMQDVLKRAVQAGGTKAAPLLHRLLMECTAHVGRAEKGRAARCMASCPGTCSLWLQALPLASFHNPAVSPSALCTQRFSWLTFA